MIKPTNVRIPADFRRGFKHNSVTGCWEWVGPTRANQQGRMLPIFFRESREGSYLAHRWIYERLVGPAGDDSLYSTCGDSLCVNPLHRRFFRGKAQVRSVRRNLIAAREKILSQ